VPMAGASCGAENRRNLHLSSRRTVRPTSTRSGPAPRTPVVRAGPTVDCRGVPPTNPEDAGDSDAG
jgi:hypothetical protein